MKLRIGDRIRIVVDDEIIAFATILGKPFTLPVGEATPPYESAVRLSDINRLKLPYPPASCRVLKVSASHRFTGPVTSGLDRQSRLDV